MRFIKVLALLHLTLFTMLSANAVSFHRYPSIWESFDSNLQADLERTLDNLGMWPAVVGKNIGLALVDITDRHNPRMASVNGDKMFYAASLPKIAILLGAFVEIEQGKMRYDANTHNSLSKMIRISSNVEATRMLNRVGKQRLADILLSDRFRLYDPTMGGGLWVGKEYGKSPAFKRDPLHNLSHGATALQTARFYYMLETDRLVSPELSFKMKRLLAHPGIHHKFVKGLEIRRPKAKIYRKSGSWGIWHSDSAIIESEDHTFIVTALIEHPKGSRWLTKLITPLHDLIVYPPEPVVRLASAADPGDLEMSIAYGEQYNASVDPMAFADKHVIMASTAADTTKNTPPEKTADNISLLPMPIAFITNGAKKAITGITSGLARILLPEPRQRPSRVTDEPIESGYQPKFASAASTSPNFTAYFAPNLAKFTAWTMLHGTVRNQPRKAQDKVAADLYSIYRNAKRAPLQFTVANLKHTIRSAPTTLSQDFTAPLAGFRAQVGVPIPRARLAASTKETSHTLNVMASITDEFRNIIRFGRGIEVATAYTEYPVRSDPNGNHDNHAFSALREILAMERQLARQASSHHSKTRRATIAQPSFLNFAALARQIFPSKHRGSSHASVLHGTLRSDAKGTPYAAGVELRNILPPKHRRTRKRVDLGPTVRSDPNNLETNTAHSITKQKVITRLF